MPLYEYRCEECGEQFELRRSMQASDDPAACPQCAGEHTKRQISLFISVNKGSQAASSGGGCGCGGACSCGGHHLN